MTSYIYRQLAAAEANINQSEREARAWFRDAAKQVKQVSGNQLMAGDRPRLLPVKRIYAKHIGRMMMYFYDPKTAAKLPYYDMFPLCIPMELYKDGFLGMNLHYLPKKLRATLLDALYETYANKQLDENKKLKIGYHLLKNSARHRYFRPTIKRYLYSHLRSRVYMVDPKEWDMMLMLPTERFVKARKEKVWRDSMDMLGLGR